MLRKLAPLALLIAVAPGCAHRGDRIPPGRVEIEPPKTDDWRQVASDLDQTRIAGVSAAWDVALGEVRSKGGDAALAAEGALLDPKAGLPRATPPPGVYRCRTVRVAVWGAKRRTRLLQSLKPGFCFVQVEGTLLTFTRGSGALRVGGRLWDDGDTRQVFLGAGALKLGDPLPAYGENAVTNQVGVIERIGDFRWRLTIPAPGIGARLDVVELLPDTPSPVRAKP